MRLLLQRVFALRNSPVVGSHASDASDNCSWPLQRLLPPLEVVKAPKVGLVKHLERNGAPS